MLCDGQGCDCDCDCDVVVIVVVGLDGCGWMRMGTYDPSCDQYTPLMMSLPGQIAALEESNRAQREKLELMQQNAANMTAADKNKLQSSHDKVGCLLWCLCW